MTDAFSNFEGWTNYDQSLWASSWHNLFSSSDGRSGLTWTNRFGVIGNFYNFYSSGENTLRNTDGHYPDPLSVYSSGEWPWVCQEMSKGGLASSLLSASSQAGWQLNTYWYIPSDPAHPGSNLRPRYPWEAIATNYTDSSHISTNDLVANPFFAMFNDSQIMDVSAGSSEATKFDVRADILGGGIPALSNPTGTNPVSAFEQLQNINLMDMETGWPQARLDDSSLNNRWLHSDFEEVSYPFVYSLYQNIVGLGGF